MTGPSRGASPSGRAGRSLGRREIVGIVLLGLVGLILRGWLIAGQTGRLHADSLTVGLMARHILEGHGYTFFWGQAYMGALEAYVAAVFFALLGPGDVALQLSPLTFSLGFLIAAYLLARRVGGARVALFTLAFLAVGPPLLTLWSITPRGGYPGMLAFGTLVLLFTLEVARDPGLGPPRRWVALGLTAGLGFWTHLLVGVYLAAAAGYLLALRPSCLRQRGPWLALGFFMIGSAPHWLHNLTSGFATFALLTRLELPAWRESLAITFTRNLPKVAGVRALTGFQALLPWGLVLLVAGVPLIALAHLSVRAVRETRAGRQAPELLLVLVVVMTAAAILLTPYGAVHAQRYWLPLFSVWPLLTALWLIRHLRGSLALAVLAVIAGVHVHGHASFEPEPREDLSTLRRDLERLGIRYAYTDYLRAASLTYYSGESLVVADLPGKWYPVAERPFAYPAVIFDRPVPWVVDALRLAGVSVVAQHAGPFVIYQTTAIHGEPRQALARHGWRADAWPNGREAWRGLDGDLQTRWTSGRPQRSGMWFRVSLGREVPLVGVALAVGPYTPDFPRTIAVEVSRDGETWDLVAGSAPYFRPGVWVHGGTFRFDPHFFDRNHPSVHGLRNSPDIRFPPRPARFVRLSLPRPAEGELRATFDWSIAELTLFAPAAGVASRPG